ncbi:uncharacterized protein Tco025E_08505 [Trypanosoma conorhini]|uniref:Uncharacterized protein n=1 Tax=Trypanosoma conorhini TaxID=83891 RepID=A0A3R7NHF3_9TRYP|nr:uncharacterized protein Tco025E_08505 [Trypanosoma conorhini]RNF02708.1 hypothetical protein Tco025E_08505 [Trypanosoma conorhini]
MRQLAPHAASLEKKRGAPTYPTAPSARKGDALRRGNEKRGFFTRKKKSPRGPRNASPPAPGPRPSGAGTRVKTAAPFFLPHKPPSKKANPPQRQAKHRPEGARAGFWLPSLRRSAPQRPPQGRAVHSRRPRSRCFIRTRPVWEVARPAAFGGAQLWWFGVWQTGFRACRGTAVLAWGRMPVKLPLPPPPGATLPDSVRVDGWAARFTAGSDDAWATHDAQVGETTHRPIVFRVPRGRRGRKEADWAAHGRCVRKYSRADAGEIRATRRRIK